MLVLAIVYLIASALIGTVVLIPVTLGLRKLKVSLIPQRVSFTLVATLLLSPVLAPAGFIMVIPLPLGFMLPFIRSVEDISYLAKIWWFLVPSVLITATACAYVACRVFPNNSSNRTRVPRAA
jgi:hypothetical protein